ncbi:hypothetical protein ACJX0J_039843, partial [Zea mays]
SLFGRWIWGTEGIIKKEILDQTSSRLHYHTQSHVCYYGLMYLILLHDTLVDYLATQAVIYLIRQRFEPT